MCFCGGQKIDLGQGVQLLGEIVLQHTLHHKTEKTGPQGDEQNHHTVAPRTRIFADIIDNPQHIDNQPREAYLERDSGKLCFGH